MELFCGKETVGIRLAEGETSYVRLAAEDLCRDIERVSLGSSGALVASDAKIFIGTKDNARAAALPLAEALLEKLSHREEYLIAVEGERTVILGNDYFGTMWGIYTFSKEYLGVDPTYLFSDLKPKKHKKLVLREGVVSDYPRTFRFRGWFINDEDLLTSWDRSAGHRPYLKINHYHIASPRAIGMVAETALRLRMNLLIPASHIDITKANEEALVKTVTDRGLYVSQHHVEPLGVISYTFRDYWKERGRDVEPSLAKYKEEYIEVWRHYVLKWSKYPNVIWQLGLRGIGDRPIWHEDPSIPDTPAAHGKVIGDAIALQSRIIQEVTGDKHPLMTSTLWMEGAELFAGGDLSLPEGTKVIFADVAFTQMMGGDFYTVPRYPEKDYGVYYHVQLSTIRNHLTEGTEPEKMLYNYKNIVAKGDTDYSVLNVSNVREFIYSISLNAAITWDIDRVTVEDFTRDFCRRVYGDAEIAALYRSYYECFFDLGIEDVSAWDSAPFYLYDYGKLPFSLVPAFDYCIWRIGLRAINVLEGREHEWKHIYSPKQMLAFVRGARERFGSLLERVYQRAQGLSYTARRAYDTHLLMHTEFLYFEHLWAENLLEAVCAEDAEKTKYIACALCEGNKMRDVAMKRCSRGKWKNWYRGSRVKGIQRLDVYEMLEYTEALLQRFSEKQ